jgi:hypothetical protein
MLRWRRAAQVVHIPREFVDGYVVSRLRTGDFIGIYAKAGGLDVTHAGFFIDTPDGPMLRDALSKKANMKFAVSRIREARARHRRIAAARVRGGVAVS